MGYQGQNTPSVFRYTDKNPYWSPLTKQNHIGYDADEQEYNDLFGINGAYSVYIHIFPNNAIYIGQTKNKLEDRWQNGNGYKSANSVLNANIKKYGWDNIEHLLYKDGLTKEEADIIEQDLIHFFSRNELSTGRVVLNAIHNIKN